MIAQPKRSLLREAKQVMDATFVGGGELAQKVRALIKEAHTNMANRSYEQAAAKLVEAYELIRRQEVGNGNVDDFRSALYALDLGLFLYVFAYADEELRKIAWDIWDARMYFQGELYEAIGCARFYLSLINDGVKHEVAVEEAIISSRVPKLKEILDRYAEQAQRGRDTGGDSEGA